LAALHPSCVILQTTGRPDQDRRFCERKAPVSKQYPVEHKTLTSIFRSDYFPSADLFVLRMPSYLHETIVASVVEDIGMQLRARASGSGPVAEFTRMIRSNGSASITFADPKFGRHDPDASFKHLSARYPGVVIEVSYSQKRGDLRRLADDYILGSDGSIRLVIGIDIGYNNKCATVSTWRPKFQVNDAGKEEFVAHQTLSNQVCFSG
jgi:hypothetical protein